MKRWSSFVLVFVALFLIAGCEDPNGDHGQGGDDETSLFVALRASFITDQGATSRAFSADDEANLPVTCNPFFTPGLNENYSDAQQRTGSCISPISVKGHVDSINLTGSYFGGGIRLLGGGSGFGQNYIIEGTVIDLADPLSLGGEDNAQDTDLANHNTRVTTRFNYLDVQFAVPRSGDVAEYWTYRYAFVPYPFVDEGIYTQTETTPGNVTFTGPNGTLADCLASDFAEAGQTATDNNTQLLGGLTGVKIGDILICRKDNATDECQISDFEWLNTTTGAFVSTRPDDADVFRFARMAEHKVTCEPQFDGPGFSVELGGFYIVADLYQAVQFTADIDRDSKIYEFQYANDMDSNKKGSEMYLYIDLDFSNSMFVHDASATNDMTLAATPDYSVYQALSDEALAEMIWFKPIMLWENSSCYPWQPGACEAVHTGVKAQIGVELSGDTEHPVYECEESDPALECVSEEDASDQSDLP